MSKLTGNDKGLAAIREAKKQLSLDLEDSLMAKVKSMAIRDGISPNDVIRKMIGLSVSPPKRPRVSVSMSESELTKVANELNIDVKDTGALKQGIKQLIELED